MPRHKRNYVDSIGEFYVVWKYHENQLSKKISQRWTIVWTEY